MSTRFVACLLLAGAALLLVGCSADEPAVPPPGGAPDFVSGDLAPGGGFAIALNAADGPDDRRIGPFILRGDNLRRVPELGALAIDLRIENAGRDIHSEPVGLTFIMLRPDSVRVLDADNGLEGPGAAIVFGFANDDARWTPGEISFPRTVHFAASEGAAVAFAARLDLGNGPLSGAVSGVVWNDRDRDGLRGIGELPLSGIPVQLRLPGCDDDCTDPAHVADHLRLAVTDLDGSYAFDNLGAGFYTVSALPLQPLEPTTPTQLHVMLAQLPDGTVSRFEEADFGFLVEGTNTVVELMPSADTTVRADVESRANDNYGCDPYVAVGRGRAGEPDRIRGLLRYDLPQFFRENTLVRATLEGQVARFRDGTGQVYHLAVNLVAPSDSTGDWIEGNGSEQADIGLGCEWVDPAFGVAWIGAGDGGDANNQTQPDFLREPVALATVVQDNMAPVTIARWDVTGLVQAWYRDGPLNHGFVIRDVDERGDFRSLWFASREGEEAGLGRAPRLVLEFEELPPPR